MSQETHAKTVAVQEGEPVRVPTTQEMLRSTALLRLRLVAVDIADLHAGLLKMGGGRFDTLVARLGEWCTTLADVETTLRTPDSQNAASRAPLGGA